MEMLIKLYPVGLLTFVAAIFFDEDLPINQALIYVGASVIIGSLASVSQIGFDHKLEDHITFRELFMIMLRGGLAAMILVMLLIESFGASWFLMGCAGAAGWHVRKVIHLTSSLLDSILEKFLPTKKKGASDADKKD